MATILITPPAVEPVSLAEARMQCRVDADDTSEDALIAVYISAARKAAEHQLGRAIITQTLEQRFDAFPAGEIQLGQAKALSIVNVKYLDEAGALQTLAPAAYSLDTFTLPGWLAPADGYDWPSTAAVINAVRVQFTAGYGPAAADVPANVRMWLLATIGTLYAQRESVDLTGRVGAMPERFLDGLLDSERVYG